MLNILSTHSPITNPKIAFLGSGTPLDKLIIVSNNSDHRILTIALGIAVAIIVIFTWWTKHKSIESSESSSLKLPKSLSSFTGKVVKKTAGELLLQLK